MQLGFYCDRLGDERRKTMLNDIIKLEKLRNNLVANGKVIPANFDPVFKIVMLDCPNYLAFLVSSFTNIPKEIIKGRIRVQNSEHKLSNAKERKKRRTLLSEMKLILERLKVKV